MSGFDRQVNSHSLSPSTHPPPLPPPPHHHQHHHHAHPSSHEDVSFSSPSLVSAAAASQVRRRALRKRRWAVICLPHRFTSWAAVTRLQPMCLHRRFPLRCLSTEVLHIQPGASREAGSAPEPPRPWNYQSSQSVRSCCFSAYIYIIELNFCIVFLLFY